MSHNAAMASDAAGGSSQHPLPPTDRRALLGRAAFLLTALGLRLAFCGLAISLAAVIAARWPWVGWVFSGLCCFVAVLQLASRSFRRFSQDEQWRQWDDLPQTWLNAGEVFRAEVTDVATRLGGWAADARIVAFPGMPSALGPVPGAPDERLKWETLHNRLARRGSWATKAPRATTLSF